MLDIVGSFISEGVGVMGTDIDRMSSVKRGVVSDYENCRELLLM